MSGVPLQVLEYGMNNVSDKTRFEDVLVFSLNPKSITIDQIYGPPRLNFPPLPITHVLIHSIYMCCVQCVNLLFKCVYMYSW